ncbi:hypothetical protein BDZ85DRAFT_259495 [Elsinoe ampelina]|uniref:Uncharacterized protein n=1 Tax=Elsinoe ampelina TaxID=302913 RepID=A0A6A6GH23_9PEZI|nr:hypothetical protein BDZ85DRAFT_259495 [Elsinoe ampelina]
MGPKSRLPPKKKCKQSQKNSPESADDFQAAADAEEETGGKWRAGDKAKSCRAFLRAIEIYDRGLGRHPRNFDLAYNKARLEFEVSQQPNLVAKLPIPLHEFLEQAFKSHRYALSLNEENTDILFNTSQILVARAELIEEESDGESFDPSLPASWLREALELLDACYTRQEMLFEEQNQAWNTREEDGGVSLPSIPRSATPSSATSAMSEQSAIVQNAVTAQDLLDTASASLSALTQLVSLDANGAQTIASLAEVLLTTKIPFCISQLPPEDQDASREEAALAQASFTAALADVEYTQQRISKDTYLERLSIFESLNLQTTEVQCDYADAMITFATSILPSDPQKAEPETLAALEKATALYQAASSTLRKPSSGKRDADGALSLSLTPKIDPEQEQRLASAIEASADARMLANRITGSGHIIQQIPMTYKDAETSYIKAGDDISAAKASIKWLISSHLNNDKRVLGNELAKRGPLAVKVLRSMIDEQVLGMEWKELIAL